MIAVQVNNLRFGAFELDWGRRMLLREGSPVHLAPKGFRLLEVLITKRPNAISKEQLHDEVWEGTFVSEATLASVVKELREALGDDARAPRFIRTLFAFGYSFCGEATEVAAPVLERKQSGFLDCNGRTTALSEGENVIGRDPAASVFIDDSTVSRHHARLTVAADRVTLEDLGSKNGTFVSGKAIETADLADGAEFDVGGVRVIFRRSLLAISTTTLDRER
ncbi:MAG TPA: FHA domain-containing protein [Thermoanaerobaculia bacterium]|nr:FHA domain-containing protein [Thermoanaerobaculia bacterium]